MRSVEEAELLLDPTHAPPLYVMQPEVKLMPLENVEVAFALLVITPELEMLKRVVVADAVDDEMLNASADVSPLLSAIANFPNGDDVPMPLEPEVGSVKPVVVAGSVPKRRLPMLS